MTEEWRKSDDPSGDDDLSATAQSALRWASSLGRQHGNRDSIDSKLLLDGVVMAASQGEGVTGEVLLSLLRRRSTHLSTDPWVYLGYAERPAPEIPHVDAAPLPLADDATAVMTAARHYAKETTGAPKISARHILLAVLVQRSGPVARLLAGAGLTVRETCQRLIDSIENELDVDKIDTWRQLVERGLAFVPPHLTSHFGREPSSDESCLDVDQYAEALAEALDLTTGEATFALFGHWGRGKTYLARRLDITMRQRTRRHRYEVVWFSAWRYPNVPEVWVHLYETLAQQAYASFPRVVRTNLARHGAMALLFALLVPAIALVPLSLWIGAAIAAASVFGLLFLYVVFRIYRAVASAHLLRNRFLSPLRHTEKLGLQATIGRDLETLVAGWLRPLPPRAGLAYAAGIAVLCIALGYDIRSLDWFKIAAIVGGIAIGAAVLGIWVARGGIGAERLLLIVDDLDRCAPGHMLQVLEALQQLVSEHHNVQLVVLAEEDVLRWAIARRYRGLVERPIDGVDKRTAELRVVRETLEKLFLAHLRLAPLSIEQLGTAMRSFVDQGSRREVARRKRENLASAPDSNASVPVAPVAPRELVNSKNHEAKAATRTERAAPRSAAPSTSSSDELVFSDGEREAILAVVPQLALAHSGQPGPRSLRGFLFRFQLARLLLRQRAVDVPPQELARALAERVAGVVLAHPDLDPGLQAVLTEVA